MFDPEPEIPQSDLELRFERLRSIVGLVVAPMLFLLIWWLPLSNSAPQDGLAGGTGLAGIMKPQAHHLAAIMATVIWLWLTEPIPMTVTALLGAAGCVVLGVADAKTVFAPFADPLMFLFIGSFMLARAIFLHGLDRRLAYGVMSLNWVGARPSRILFAYGAVTAFISAWISNTATTAMMLAIGLSLVRFLKEASKDSVRIDPRFATGLMLMTSFAASIGGLATPIGTPPNVIGLRFIERELGIEIPFLKWMVIGVPVVALLYLFLFGYLNRLCPAGVRELPGSQDMLHRNRDSLGAWTAGQKSTLISFGLTTLLWVLPGIVALFWGEQSPLYSRVRSSLPDGVVAILGASLLFLLPGNCGGRAIDWSKATQIDWGVVLLYGGGFTLGELANQTGLANAVGNGLAGLLPGGGDWTLLVGGTLLAALVSEATSNTASANIVVMLVISMARSAGVDPLAPALGATFGASLGFMLPVSTPCNAIVYGTGLVPLPRMIRYGLLLDVVGVAVIILLVRFLLPWIR
ncbi:MAG: SLC13 family permease [Planctomycetaceae bacterium]